MAFDPSDRPGAAEVAQTCETLLRQIPMEHHISTEAYGREIVEPVHFDRVRVPPPEKLVRAGLRPDERAWIAGWTQGPIQDLRPDPETEEARTQRVADGPQRKRILADSFVPLPPLADPTMLPEILEAEQTSETNEIDLPTADAPVPRTLDALPAPGDEVTARRGAGPTAPEPAAANAAPANPAARPPPAPRAEKPLPLPDATGLDPELFLLEKPRPETGRKALLFVASVCVLGVVLALLVRVLG
jgi:hypothetical protein